MMHRNTTAKTEAHFYEVSLCFREHYVLCEVIMQRFYEPWSKMMKTWLSFKKPFEISVITSEFGTFTKKMDMGSVKENNILNFKSIFKFDLWIYVFLHSSGTQILL